MGFGCLMVHSASITSWPTEFEQVYLSRHLKFLVVGVISATIAAHLPARFWRRVAPVMFLVTVLLLVCVLIPGVGKSVNGSRRWFRIGSLSFQPSELAKITLPLFLAGIICRLREENQLHKFIRGTLPVLLPLGCVVPLVALEPDLGTTVFLTIGAAILLFVGGWPLRNFFAGLSVAVPAVAVIIMKNPYQLKRVTGFLAAWKDLNQAPYQLKQSLISLGAGGTFGLGLGKGWQKLSFLPEANTDFVFAVVGEELGLVGTLSVVGIWLAVFVLGLKLLSHLPRWDFAYLAGITLLTQIVLQAAVNVAVVTAMIPPKGISHPLLSYGGSSLVMTLISFGLIISFSHADSRSSS